LSLAERNLAKNIIKLETQEMPMKRTGRQFSDKTCPITKDKPLKNFQKNTPQNLTEKLNMYLGEPPIPRKSYILMWWQENF
jgi:hypothetical protein